MADAMANSHWCYMCRQRVSPVMEFELKCPFCDGGFVEEIAGRETAESEDIGSQQAISSRASVTTGNSSRQTRSRRFPRIEDDDDSDLEREIESILWRRGLHETVENVWRMEEGNEESDAELEVESIVQRRRQSSAILQLLHSLQEDFRSESDEAEIRELVSERESERLVLINSFNEAVILEGSFDTEQNPNHELDSANIGASIGDYFVGPGLELLLQHLSENDPNCYGTPPAQKEAIEALPAVKIVESINCSVCLEDLVVGMKAKEMPCNHKFHKECILPWLELHSSCPVCRFQMPADESNKTLDGSSVESREGGVGGDGGARGRMNRSRAPPSLAFSRMF